MDSYEILLSDIKDTVRQIQGLYDLAYEQYSEAVNEVLEDRLTNERQIERILDGIIDFGDDERFLDLSKKLCRHIYSRYPQLVGDFVSMYRTLFVEASDEGDENK